MFTSTKVNAIAASIVFDEHKFSQKVLDHIVELQQTLLRDDAYLPGIVQTLPDLTAQCQAQANQGDPVPVRDGADRPVGAMPSMLNDVNLRMYWVVSPPNTPFTSIFG
jgi:hypothetical protein